MSHAEFILMNRLNPYAKPDPALLAAADPNTLHAKLSTFPTLLPSNPPAVPDILSVSSPGGYVPIPLRHEVFHNFLTGTFPLDYSKPHPAVLKLAKSANRLTSLMNAVLRGLTEAESAFRESEKQTMIWREELESCGLEDGSKFMFVLKQIRY